MEKTKKQLQESLDLMTADRDKFYKKFYDLDEERRRKENQNMCGLQEENGRIKEQVLNLLEIIRWHINPETAKSPFTPTKDQRDERKNY